MKFAAHYRLHYRSCSLRFFADSFHDKCETNSWAGLKVEANGSSMLCKGVTELEMGWVEKDPLATVSPS